MFANKSIALSANFLVLQVNITWEDILQEEHNKGIFEMELEEWEDNMRTDAEVGVKVCF